MHEIPHEEKADLMGRARAVLFPIDWEEPFGLVMAEANACGTAVLATPRGAAPEVIADGETGFLLPVEGFADAAVNALKHVGDIDPHACRKRVEEKFTATQMVEGYLEVYERVLASG
jgi:glycosyltransferase involved in cell wall biosynthesis